jgi:endonuclease YncB( thermonuclease family)
MFKCLSCIKCIVPDKLRLRVLEKKKYPFSFEIYDVYVNEVVDGDTYHITFLYNNKPLTLKLRLSGADTPELHSKNDKEKEAAQQISLYVKELIEHNYFKCSLKKWDKYGGRVVGDIQLNKNLTLSELLVSLKYAKTYEGNKKEIWKDAELNHIIKSIKKDK